MPFDAGTILGHLDMETGGFTSGMLGAESIAHAFGPTVEAFMVDPILGFVEVTKKAAEAAVEMGHKLIEAVVEVGNAAAEAGFAAQKAGVTVEYFSALSHVAATVGVSAESLGNSFKFLQRTASEAVDGLASKQQIEAFEKLGISMQFLKQNLGDPAAIFERMKSGLDGLGSQAERTQVQMALLSRGGGELIPLFNLASDRAAKLTEIFKELGATETTESAKTGGSFKTLETIVDSAWEGIKKAVAEPILDFLAKHIDEIVPVIVKATNFIRESIGNVFEYVEGASGQHVIQVFESIGTELFNIGKIYAEFIGDRIESQLPLFEKFVDLIGDTLVPALQILEPLLEITFRSMSDILHVVDSLSGGLLDVANGLNSVGLAGSKLPGLSSNASENAEVAGATHQYFLSTEIGTDQAAAVVAKELQKMQRTQNTKQKKAFHSMMNYQHVKTAFTGGKKR